MRHRVDENQKVIVQELRARGMSVIDVHNLGFADISVGFQGVNFYFEIKNPNRAPSKRRLTPTQKARYPSWRGQIDVIEVAHEALTIIYRAVGYVGYD